MTRPRLPDWRLVGVRKCPRCEAGLIDKRDKVVSGHEDEVDAPLIGDEYEIGSLSRVTRDPGTPVFVCNRCGEREARLQFTGRPLPPLTDWPLSLEQVVAEERVLLEAERASKVMLMLPVELNDSGSEFGDDD